MRVVVRRVPVPGLVQLGMPMIMLRPVVRVGVGGHLRRGTGGAGPMPVRMTVFVLVRVTVPVGVRMAVHHVPMPMLVGVDVIVIVRVGVAVAVAVRVGGIVAVVVRPGVRIVRMLVGEALAVRHGEPSGRNGSLQNGDSPVGGPLPGLSSPACEAGSGPVNWRSPSTSSRAWGPPSCPVDRCAGGAMFVPTPEEIQAKRAGTYRYRSLFLLVSAVLVLAAHPVDRMQAGGAAPAALALRLGWCALLLLTALGLRRGGPASIALIRLVTPAGSALLFLGLVQVTGGAHSPVFPFVYVLVVLLPILTYDARPYGVTSAAFTLAASWRIIVRDGVRGADLWGWVHIGATAFALGWVLAWAFGRALETARTALAERQAALERLQQTLAENQQLVGDLRTALGNVRTLRGLLPICAFCKKIRNDDGYWEQLEQYVSAHSDAVFSHSFCPECAREQYPEHVED